MAVKESSKSDEKGKGQCCKFEQMCLLIIAILNP
jgi:hypothetical protein